MPELARHILSEPITRNLFAGTAIVLAYVALSERRGAPGRGSRRPDRSHETLSSAPCCG
jgi:hypothetical protein